MSNMLALLAATGGGAPKLYAEDVFSAYTYTGNGSTQTIVNGIDLVGKGGMVWIKNRATAFHHVLSDTARGYNKILEASNTNGQYIAADRVTGFLSNGFSVGGDGGVNEFGGIPMVSWTFRNAPKFFHHQQVTKSAGSNATVDLSTLGTVGMVKVKRTDAAGSWYVWHRSLSAGMLLIGETTAAEATLGHITVSGTTLTLVNGVIADGTYHVEAYAHDDSPDGLIQCGSLTTDGSGNATVPLGWEPQYLLLKRQDAVDQWYLIDDMRGWPASSPQIILMANASSAEATDDGGRYKSAIGLTFKGSGANRVYDYLAIRRPNKPPTSGTQVYNAIARTGTGAAATVTGVGFAPDLIAVQFRTGGGNPQHNWHDRLRGALMQLWPASTSAESSVADEVTGFDVMDGVRLGASSNWRTNDASTTYINHFFKRAPGFMDICCYTGTGVAHTEAHNLKAVPELMIVKSRNTAATNWIVRIPALGVDTGAMNDVGVFFTGGSGYWDSAQPTSTVFPVGTLTAVNLSAATYVAYLFATLAGISKCGSYTGTAATLQINCGFTAGARFILIKRTDAAGDWYVWDSVRGIIAGNDPTLLLNSTAAEVTTTDYIDPYAAGFELSSTAPAAINASGGNFIYFAVA